MKKKIIKKYNGFESIIDIEQDIYDILQYDDLIPDGEWLGTLTLTLEYEEENLK
jgi:hypothetical protein